MFLHDILLSAVNSLNYRLAVWSAWLAAAMSAFRVFRNGLVDSDDSSDRLTGILHKMRMKGGQPTPGNPHMPYVSIFTWGCFVKVGGQCIRQTYSSSMGCLGSASQLRMLASAR